MGKWFDKAKDAAVAAGNDVSKAEAVAGTDTLMKVAIMPAILPCDIYSHLFCQKK
jgi:hypothetical protein